MAVRYGPVAPIVGRARAALVGASFRQAALPAATFAQSDVRNADFSGANLRGACFDRAILDGAHLEGATLTGATFTGVPIGALLTCGMAPRDLLSHRASADPRCFTRLLFGPQASGARFAVTAQEAAAICRSLEGVTWDRLENASAFAALYSGEAWADWLARCASRRVLSWAVAHRASLQTLPERPFVHYGRVLPSALLDEVTEDDLRQGGMATNPERLFNSIGTRRLQARAELHGQDTPYPRAPFSAIAGVAQITSRHALELEGAAMGHCVAGYHEACRAGECYIFHIGEPAPRGSTLEVLADGSIGQHFARLNGDPGQQEEALAEAWLRAQAPVRGRERCDGPEGRRMGR